jgi:hypothetical protein
MLMDNMDFLYVLGTAGSVPPSNSSNIPIAPTITLPAGISPTASTSAQSLVPILLIVLLAVLIVGFILYRRHLKERY